MAETTFLVQETETYPETTLSAYSATNGNGLIVPNRVFYGQGLALPGSAMNSMVWRVLTSDAETGMLMPDDITSLEVTSRSEMLGRISRFITSHIPTDPPQVEESLVDDIKERLAEDNPEMKDSLEALGLLYSGGMDQVQDDPDLHTGFYL